MASFSPLKHRHWPHAVLVVLLLVVVIQPASALGRNQDDPLPTLAATPVAEEGAPVVVNERELFRLNTRIGSITAVERAALVSEHIGRLANNPFSGPIVISVVDVEGATDIVAGEEILVSVSDADAAAAGRARHEVAQEWATAIQTVVNGAQSGSRVETVTTGVAVTLSVLLVLVLLFWLLNRFSNWLTDKLDPATESGWVPRSLIQSEVYQSGGFSRIVRLLMRLLKLILAIFLFTVAIPVILRSFDRTRELGTQFGRLLLGPLAELWDGFVTLLPDLVFIVVLGSLTWVATRLVRLFFREVERGVVRIPSFEPEWASLTGRIVAIFLIGVAVIIGFNSLPFAQLPVFQGISAFLALLLTLASSSAIANIIAGIILTYTGAFRLGDIIAIQTTTGEVVGKYLLTTRVRTFKNEVVSFPNSLVLSNSVTNYTRLAREKGLVLYTTVTIGYDVPWQQVHELLIGAAQDTPDLLKNPAPFVLQKALNDFSVAYELNALTRKPELLPRLYSSLHSHIQDRFAAAGIEIMSPTYNAIRDGNNPMLPRVISDERSVASDE